MPFDGRLARFIAIISVLQLILLLNASWIAISRVMSLIFRRWRCCGGIAAVPSIPVTPALFPVATPVISPSRRSIGAPTTEIGRGVTVIPHRDTQDENRHNFRADYPPRTVVPGTGIPVIVLVDPIHTVIEEKVCRKPRRVIDRIPRHYDHVRIRRDVDTDIDMGSTDANAEPDIRDGQRR